MRRGWGIFAILIVAVITAAFTLFQPRQRVVVFGDSIMKGLAPSILLDGDIDQSVSGLAIPQIAQIIDNYRKQTKFRDTREVILQGGINDLLINGKAAAQIGASYRQILSDIPNHIPVLIIGILPFDQATIWVDPSDAASANREIAAVCEKRERCTFTYGRSISPDMLSDGLHLNAIGKSSLAKELRAFIY